MIGFGQTPERDCDKYAKEEDVAAAPEEKSSDEEVSQDDYGASSDKKPLGIITLLDEVWYNKRYSYRISILQLRTSLELV